MSHDAPGPRPRQVTIGGWVIAVASAMLVVTVYDAMANLHSVDTRDKLMRELTTGSMKGLGITLTDALDVFRGALFVAGLAAVVTGILGVFVLQRHTTARIVLTVAAVPVVLTAPFAGGFLGVLIGGATGLLWTQEARDWFAGRAPARPVSSAPVPSAVPSTTVPAPMPSQPSVDERASWAPPNVSAAAPLSLTASPPPAPVPAQVRAACLLTWTFSALTALVYVTVLVAVAADRSHVLELARDNAALRSSSLSDRGVIAFLVALSAGAIAWCILAAVLAALAWRRQPVARSLLLLSAGAAFVVGLVGLPYSLVHLAASAVAFVLLLTRTARGWFGPSRARVEPPHRESWPPPDPHQKPPVW
jgi:hypothetical protein